MDRALHQADNKAERVKLVPFASSLRLSYRVLLSCTSTRSASIGSNSSIPEPFSMRK
jgi:hypothetical protein